MVKYRPGLDSTFAALADPTRRAILTALSRGEGSVGELARPHQMSLPAVMKHLRVLEQAGLVSHWKTGRVRHCRLAAPALKEAADWLSNYRLFWENQLASLDRFLKEEQDKETSPCPKRKPHPRRRSR